MTQKGEILTTLEESIKILTLALEERERELRALLYAFEVSKVEDLDDIEHYRLGSELEDQISEISDILGELKYKIVRIGAFKEV